MEREEVKTTLVPFLHKGERFCLLVAVVVPSFNGSDPKMTVHKRIFDGFRETYGRGPNHEFDNPYVVTFRWPICFAEPDWLYARMGETEYYWRHCYERREPQMEDLNVTNATEGTKSSSAA
ncbi:hypothetical protein CPB85DRAFT_1430421 [Mucidula mucida]|nr:hypothetical protein CPB85DRAFT_1430421 [Mucidula mucida]